MIKLKGLIVGFILLCLFLTITGCERKERKAIIGAPAPQFTLTNLNGQKVSLSDYSGKVILLDFWATWCPPCKESIPHLETLYRRYKDKGFVVIGISFDEDIETVKRFKDKYNMTYPILMGEEWIKNDYGITGVPEMFMLGRDSILKSHRLGFNESLAALMDQEIRGLL